MAHARFSGTRPRSRSYARQASTTPPSASGRSDACGRALVRSHSESSPERLYTHTRCHGDALQAASAVHGTIHYGADDREHRTTAQHEAPPRSCPACVSPVVSYTVTVYAVACTSLYGLGRVCQCCKVAAICSMPSSTAFRSSEGCIRMHHATTCLTRLPGSLASWHSASPFLQTASHSRRSTSQ